MKRQGGKTEEGARGPEGADGIREDGSWHHCMWCA